MSDIEIDWGDKEITEERIPASEASPGEKCGFCGSGLVSNEDGFIEYACGSYPFICSDGYHTMGMGMQSPQCQEAS
jgi:hypothetical protein